MNMKVILSTLVALFIAFLIFLGFSLNNNPSLLPSVLEGKTIPAFKAMHLEDASKSLTEKSIKGPSLINVWATWCPTCRSEHEMLNKLSKQGIMIYGINYKDDPQLAMEWLKELGNPYQFNINDQKGQLGIDLGVYGAPETFFINQQGQIVLRHVGDINETNWEKDLRPVWESITTPTSSAPK